jgi:acyl-coenzyme A thioesterase PaaI-like protein
MGKRTQRRKARQEELLKKIAEDPFLTDQELAEMLSVSVQTIRLDRLQLNIPEVRERIKSVAQNAAPKVRSLTEEEVMGELIDLELGKQAISVLETKQELAFKRTGIVRGHHLFAQANSLAVALVDAPVALTGTCTVRFCKPVKVGQRLVAKAEVIEKKKNKYTVEVRTKVGQHEILVGTFVVFALEEVNNDSDRS